MGLRPDIPCKKHKNGSIELYATIANTKRGCAYFDTPSKIMLIVLSKFIWSMPIIVILIIQTMSTVATSISTINTETSYTHNNYN